MEKRAERGVCVVLRPIQSYVGRMLKAALLGSVAFKSAKIRIIRFFCLMLISSNKIRMFGFSSSFEIRVQHTVFFVLFLCCS